MSSIFISFHASISSVSYFILADSTLFAFLNYIIIGHRVTVPSPFGSWIAVILSSTEDFPADWQPTEHMQGILTPVSNKWTRILSKQSKIGRIDCL